MTLSRRSFLASGAVAAAGVTVLPFAPRAAGAEHVFETPAGPVKVNPVMHASIVLETPRGTIYVDPVGDPAAYSAFPKADFVLITHQHGDHYKPETLEAIRGGAPMLTNPAVAEMLPESLKPGASQVANGGTAEALGISIEAIPAYNITEERKNFHPRGRDNGYVLNLEGFRIYISGDTEDIPEMRALRGIDLAFVCMNLPFTMTAEAAADAVAEFRPTYVYPYHYRGRDGGTQDPMEFARLVGDASEVRFGDWYGAGPGKPPAG